MKDVSIAAVAAGIYEDFEGVVEVLRQVAPELGCDNAFGFRIKTVDSKIDGAVRVQNPHFGLLRGCAAFVRLPLAEVRDRLRLLPKRVVECPIGARRSLDASRFGNPRPCGRSSRPRLPGEGSAGPHA